MTRTETTNPRQDYNRAAQDERTNTAAKGKTYFVLPIDSNSTTTRIHILQGCENTRQHKSKRQSNTLSQETKDKTTTNQDTTGQPQKQDKASTKQTKEDTTKPQHKTRDNHKQDKTNTKQDKAKATRKSKTKIDQQKTITRADTHKTVTRSDRHNKRRSQDKAVRVRV